MFEIVLSNNNSETKLSCKLYNTSIAERWFDELQKNYSIYENDRFTKWNTTTLVTRANFLINEINCYDNIIDRFVTNKTTQTDLNYLHKFFEDLRGNIETGTSWYNNAPKQIQMHVNEFNIIIHKLESYIRKYDQPSLVVTFKDRKRLPLNKQDYKEFTHKWKRNTVYINYCHVGKPILDLYKDKDIYCKRIEPQTHYSADFMIKFGPTIPWLAWKYKDIMLRKFINKNNLQYSSIGMIPVAYITSKFNLNELKNYDTVKEIICN